MEAALLNAENITRRLFDAVEKNGLLIPGKTEEQLVAEIDELAIREFGILSHWHKKIVRVGRNTMSVYNDNPPNQVLQDDDMLFVDLGPVVKGWEADLGRTYVTGSNAGKLQLKKDVEKAWYETQHWYQRQSSVKASDLFLYVVEKAAAYGWGFGGEIAGHIVGKYPHEQPADPKSVSLDIHPNNHNDMLLPDADGNKRHWILELHFIDIINRTGAYFEQLL